MKQIRCLPLLVLLTLLSATGLGCKLRRPARILPGPGIASTTHVQERFPKCFHGYHPTNWRALENFGPICPTVCEYNAEDLAETTWVGEVTRGGPVPERISVAEPSTTENKDFAQLLQDEFKTFDQHLEHENLGTFPETRLQNSDLLLPHSQ